VAHGVKETLFEASAAPSVVAWVSRKNRRIGNVREELCRRLVRKAGVEASTVSRCALAEARVIILSLADPSIVTGVEKTGGVDRVFHKWDEFVF
jgi:hypothetical protein